MEKEVVLSIVIDLLKCIAAIDSLCIYVFYNIFYCEMFMIVLFCLAFALCQQVKANTQQKRPFSRRPTIRMPIGLDLETKKFEQALVWSHGDPPEQKD